MQRQKNSPYAQLIGDATGAPDHLLPLLENLMRDEVFHSTLDWQSAAQLADGARQAYDLYRSAPAYYDGLLLLQRAEFRLVGVERKLESARRSGRADRIAELETQADIARQHVQRSREAIPRLTAFYSPT